jgi:1,2-dihydroxy-3-keto-5-methylthiopentene dioxygenase
MTLLQVMADNDAAEVRLRTDDANLIGKELATRDILFDHWPIAADLEVSRAPGPILAAFADRVAAINRDGRYRHIDVAALQPDDSDPGWQATATTARSKFLAEHRHAEDEVRFFVAGRGCFYLHLEPEVLAVVCEGGDVLSVPAGTRHWFDMGSRPDFVAIRFFEQDDGWIGDFTGDAIGERFPTLDQLVAT